MVAFFTKADHSLLCPIKKRYVDLGTGVSEGVYPVKALH